MQDRTHNDVSYRILYGLDEYTREYLAVKVARGLIHKEVLTNLSLYQLRILIS
ncbi:MAG: hypothetical protein K8R16_08560 [Anaerolineales bacterium]|nr:hypothetical protein [Anaerolineales bacterium]